VIVWGRVWGRALLPVQAEASLGKSLATDWHGSTRIKIQIRENPWLEFFALGEVRYANCNFKLKDKIIFSRL